tara:strand:+ start:209 stop:463 length:255 start_codon:yes stop_codon:yes gene_type:complete
MKYVLIENRSNEIVDTIDLNTLDEAEKYFLERKQMYHRIKFYSIWTIKSKKVYDLNEDAFKRKPSSESIEWWKEEQKYLDIDKS